MGAITTSGNTGRHCTNSRATDATGSRSADSDSDSDSDFDFDFDFDSDEADYSTARTAEVGANPSRTGVVAAAETRQRPANHSTAAKKTGETRTSGDFAATSTDSRADLLPCQKR